MLLECFSCFVIYFISQKLFTFNSKVIVLDYYFNIQNDCEFNCGTKIILLRFIYISTYEKYLFKANHYFM